MSILFDSMIHKARIEGNVPLEQWWQETKSAFALDKPAQLQPWLQARVNSYKKSVEEKPTAKETLEMLNNWGSSK